jgi:serine/threonine-protein kinase RIO1
VTKRSAVVLARTSRVAAEGPRAADTREDRDVQFLEYDEDVVTPEENSEIRRLFRNSRLKGYIAKKTSNIELQILNAEDSRKRENASGAFDTRVYSERAFRQYVFRGDAPTPSR